MTPFSPSEESIALVQRLFDLSSTADAQDVELARLDALVYSRMATTYGMPPLAGDTRMAA